MIWELVLGATFVLLALLAVRFWLRARDTSSLYIMLIFIPIGLIQLWGLWWDFIGPPDTSQFLFQAGTRIVFVLLFAYPWALYQFSCYTRGKQSRLGRLLAAGITSVLSLFVIFAPWPSPNDPSWYQTLLSTLPLILAIQFVSLSVTATVKLWLSGSGQPIVVRKRLRLMSVAAILLSGALVVSTTSGPSVTRATWSQGLFIALALIAAFAFAICLAPPSSVRVYWSNTAVRTARIAIHKIITADSRVEAVSLALPIMAEVVGSESVRCYDTDGELLASWSAVESDQTTEDDDTHTVVIPMEGEGQIVLKTNTLWPFVGEEEMDVLKFIGSTVGLALNRRRLDEANAQLLVQSAVERSLRMQASELERANRELNEFVAVASHDLQTPVRNIIDNVDFLQEDLTQESELSYEAREDLRYIRDGAHRVKALIDGLLHYTRIDAMTEREVASIDLNEVLDQVQHSMASQLVAADASIEVEPLPKVKGVLSELGEVFSNLLDNAIKYRRPDQPLHVHVTAQLAGEGFVDILFSDNGLGVAPAFRGRVFEMFKRLHNQEEIEGTGIGLAVCRKIVERAGGHIVFVNPESEGATVKITLPIAARGHLGQVA